MAIVLQNHFLPFLQVNVTSKTSWTARCRRWRISTSYWRRRRRTPCVAPSSRNAAASVFSSAASNPSWYVHVLLYWWNLFCEATLMGVQNGCTFSLKSPILWDHHNGVQNGCTFSLKTCFVRPPVVQMAMNDRWRSSCGGISDLQGNGYISW